MWISECLTISSMLRWMDSLSGVWGMLQRACHNLESTATAHWISKAMEGRGRQFSLYHHRWRWATLIKHGSTRLNTRLPSTQHQVSLLSVASINRASTINLQSSLQVLLDWMIHAYGLSDFTHWFEIQRFEAFCQPVPCHKTWLNSLPICWSNSYTMSTQLTVQNSLFQYYWVNIYIYV